MGSFYMKDNISNTIIEEQAEVIIFPMVRDHDYNDWEILPTMLNGIYCDYGNFELDTLSDYQKEQLELWNKHITIKTEQSLGEFDEFDDFYQITEDSLNANNKIKIEGTELEIKIIAIPIRFLEILKEEWKDLKFNYGGMNKATEDKELMLKFSFNKSRILQEFLEIEHKDKDLYELLYKFLITNRIDLNYALDYGSQDSNVNNMEVLQKYYKEVLDDKYEHCEEKFYNGWRYFNDER